ncbi:MAG TPA: hypothetical protein ENK44_14680 [Caldithrix abyssi]|uniref:Uncharacterized protein n=1 Tax=Caldithrix abyssi TaxID=187145 RepID=A0A7V4U2N6_CALAY|nr:hypothetical protein [Caldithrix abyssi]
MILIKEPIAFKTLWQTKEIDLGGIIKIVVDISKKIIGADEEMHADIEEKLLEEGSKQQDLWGANLELTDDGYRIEYTSFINIRPANGNRSMEVEDEALRAKIQSIITELIR